MALVMPGLTPAVEPSFPGPVEFLRTLWTTARARLGRPVDPLNSFFRVSLAHDQEDVARLLAALLRGQPGVKVAVVAPRATVELRSGAPPRPGLMAQTPNLEMNQGYLEDSAGGGIGARRAWQLPGGDGAGIRLCDCEGGFDGMHEDLPQVRVVSQRGNNLGFDADHGTKSLGVMTARHDTKGVTGVAHAAEPLFGSEAPDMATGVFFRTAAINDSLRHLRNGDVLVLEMHADFKLANGTVVSVPAELDPAVHAASVNAAGNGITVVAAAGNGPIDLTPLKDAKGRSIWASPTAAADDSLAVIVGAGLSISSGQPQVRIGSSNHGRRVTCQGWGDFVATCSIQNGDLFNGGLHRRYTRFFGQTSAATAIIGGLVACLQGRAKARLGRPLDPRDVRTLLRNQANGLAQPSHDAVKGLIGPLPDLIRLFSAAGVQ